MKEIQTPTKENIEQVKPVEQHQKKPQLIHRMRPQKGQKVFEFSLEENTLKLAKYNQPETIEFTKAQKGDMSGMKKKRIDINTDSFYLLALNFKNALKKLKQIFPDVEPKIEKS